MKILEKRFFEYAQQKLTALNLYFDIYSSVTTESIYVFDILQKRFCNIKSDDFFLCGFSLDFVLNDRFDFYSKIIYPEDLSLCIDMHNAILQYPKDFDDRLEKIDYVFCTFRLQGNYSFLNRSLPQMVYHRMKYVCENDELRYLICSVGSSTIPKTGNLRIYYKDGLTYEEYNFITKRWKRKIKELLTEREKAILMLAQQGKSSKEIANYLYKAHNTVRNQIKYLFTKLNVHSMQEAIEFARHHGIT